MNLLNTITPIITGIVDDHQLELVELDLFEGGDQKILKIFVWKDGGVTIDDCSRLSREVGYALDLEDSIPFAYRLEVSSPGLDRPLKSKRDFERNLERLVKVRLVEPLGDRKRVIGKLVAVSDEGIQLLLEDEELSLAYDAMLSAKVEIEF